MDLTGTTLTFIGTLTTDSTLGTTFTVDQTDITGLTSVVGGKGTGDILKAVNTAGNTIDIHNLKLTGIETIQTDTKDGHVDLTVGGQGGVKLELGATSVGTDTIIFTDDYKVTTVTNATTILAHTLTIENFKEGATKGDVLDLGGLLNGNVTASSTVDVTKAADLKAALNIAAAGDGSETSKVVTFDFGGDTYVLVDNSAGKAITADDAVIKLVGTHTLVDADNFLF
jgi:S-layer protein